MRTLPLGSQSLRVLMAMPLVADKHTAARFGLRTSGLHSVIKTLRRRGLIQEQGERLSDGRCGHPPRVWRRVASTGEQHA